MLKNSMLNFFSPQKIHRRLHDTLKDNMKKKGAGGKMWERKGKGGILVISVTKELSKPGLYKSARSSERGLITQSERKHLCEVFLNF